MAVSDIRPRRQLGLFLQLEPGGASDPAATHHRRLRGGPIRDLSCELAVVRSEVQEPEDRLGELLAVPAFAGVPVQARALPFPLSLGL